MIAHKVGQSSGLIILDAKSFTEIGRAYSPPEVRVPMTFHGEFDRMWGNWEHISTRMTQRSTRGLCWVNNGRRLQMELAAKLCRVINLKLSCIGEQAYSSCAFRHTCKLHDIPLYCSFIFIEYYRWVWYYGSNSTEINRLLFKRNWIPVLKSLCE